MIHLSSRDSSPLAKKLKSSFAEYALKERKGPYPRVLKDVVREAHQAGIELDEIARLSGRSKAQLQLWIDSSNTKSLRRLSVVSDVSMVQQPPRLRIYLPSGAYVDLEEGALLRSLFDDACVRG